VSYILGSHFTGKSKRCSFSGSRCRRPRCVTRFSHMLRLSFPLTATFTIPQGSTIMYRDYFAPRVAGYEPDIDTELNSVTKRIVAFSTGFIRQHVFGTPMPRPAGPQESDSSYFAQGKPVPPPNNRSRSSLNGNGNGHESMRRPSKPSTPRSVPLPNSPDPRY
jgi:hypothetical protein